MEGWETVIKTQKCNIWLHDKRWKVGRVLKLRNATFSYMTKGGSGERVKNSEMQHLVT